MVDVNKLFNEEDKIAAKKIGENKKLLVRFGLFYKDCCTSCRSRMIRNVGSNIKVSKELLCGRCKVLWEDLEKEFGGLI